MQKYVFCLCINDKKINKSMHKYAQVCMLTLY